MIIRRPLLSHLRQMGAVVTTLSLIGPVLPLQAGTRRGDRLVHEAQIAESKQDWDSALILSEQAVKADPADPGYQLEFRRVRFEAASFLITNGQSLRDKGKLGEALSSFQRAYQIDPSNDLAAQEVENTKRMIDRVNRMKAADPTAKITPEEESLTPAEVAKRDTQKQIDNLLPPPELRVLNPQPIVLKMSNQKPKVLFDTLGKLAGINVLFDPDYDTAANKPQSIDLNGTTLTEALDDLAVETHSYWKPLSSNTIFVTQESPTKRREYEDQEVKVFYLSNVTSPQELQEMITTLRQVIEVTKLFNYSSQNAIVVRAEPAKMALAEKIIADLDKPRQEVLVDVAVMEVNSTRARQLAAAFAPTGISTPITFTPRTSIQTLAGQLTSSTSSTSTGFSNNGTSSTSTSTTGTSTTSATTGTTSSTSTSTNPPIPLVNFPHIGTQDFSLENIPGGLLEAIMSDSATRVLQRPQIRSVNNQKATLKIGEKIPTASGSYSPGTGGVGVNALVNTQFTYIDTGVNLEMTPFIHDNGEISMHIDIDISQVDSYNDLGGISEPVIGQHKTTVDVRMKDGQINMIGGLVQISDSKTKSGVPGLADIPILSRLFSSEQTTVSKDEIVITLIPHIVRSREITKENEMAALSGNQTNYQVRYAEPPMGTAPVVNDGFAPTTPAAPGNTVMPGTPVVPGAIGVAIPGSGRPGVFAPGAPGAPVSTPTVPGGAVPTGAPAARISFAPSRLDVQTGSSFTVSIRADGAKDLQSIEAGMHFDPKVLRINSITAGDLLQKDGPPLVPQKNILNDSGDASATLAREPSKGGVSGSGSLLTINFQAIGKGQTVVTLPKAVLHGSSGPAVTVGSGPLTVAVK